MKTKDPQISQITQIVEAERRLWGYKGYQNGRVQTYLRGLCNLRNLRRKSIQESI